MNIQLVSTVSDHTHLLRRRNLLRGMATASLGFLALPIVLRAQEFEAPDTLIMRVGNEVMRQIRSDPALRAGTDIERIITMVDAELMPHVNFVRMTSSAVGRHWRMASPEQRERLQTEFKRLLVRTYSGAMSRLRDDHNLALRPSRFSPQDAEVVVRTELRGRTDPIQIDYRMERTPQGWKVFDLNVMGIWLVDTYRNQFSAEINARGLDGLIATLERNNRAAAGARG